MSTSGNSSRVSAQSAPLTMASGSQGGTSYNNPLYKSGGRSGIRAGIRIRSTGKTNSRNVKKQDEDIEKSAKRFAKQRRQEENVNLQKSTADAADAIAKKYSINTRDITILEKMIEKNKALTKQLRKAKEEASKYKAKSDYRGNVITKTAATFAALTLATGAITYGTWDKFLKNDPMADPKMYKEYANFIIQKGVPFLVSTGYRGGELAVKQTAGMLYQTTKYVLENLAGPG